MKNAKERTKERKRAKERENKRKIAKERERQNFKRKRDQTRGKFHKKVK